MKPGLIRPIYLIVIYLLLSFRLGSLCYSQSSQYSSIADSLSALIKTDEEDSNKVIHLNALGWELMYQNPDTSIVLSKQALQLASVLEESPLATEGSALQRFAKKGIAKSCNNLGVYYWLKGEYSISLTYHLKALEIRELLGDKKGIAGSLNNIGSVYKDQGDYPKALTYYFKALRLAKEVENKNGMTINLGNIGTIYYEQGDYAQALQYQLWSLKLKQELGDRYNMAITLGNIGSIYVKKGDYSRALEYYLKALKLDEEFQNDYGMELHLGDIGNAYFALKDYPKALENYGRALKLAEELGDKSNIVAWLSNIGSVYAECKKYKEAEVYLLKALKISEEIGALGYIQSTNKELSNLYHQTQRHQLAYEHHVKYTLAKDSLFNDDKSKEIGKLEARHEMELDEIERAKKAAEEAAFKKQERKRKNMLQYSAIMIVLVMIGLIVLVLSFKKVSPRFASAIIFLSFLLLFEFLLVWLDPFVERFTGGEPAVKLMINALVAILIFPLNTSLEKLLKKRLTRKMD